MSRKYRISGYEWELLESEGHIAGLSQQGWYEFFIATNDLDYLDRLLEFYTPPADQCNLLYEGSEEVVYQKTSILFTDRRPLKEVLENPQFLCVFSWREFEEITAELLRKLGYKNIILGQGSKDNGVDITAYLEHAIGIERIIVQCKKNSPENKVGEPVIKQLLADVEIHDASRGLIVTTSTLTKPANLLIQERQHKISAIDRLSLRKLIEDVNFNPFVQI